MDCGGTRILKKVKSSRGHICVCRCDICGKEFNRRYAHAKKSKHLFCSMNCKSKWYSKIMIGKNNPMYHNGRKAEKSSNWKGGRVINRNYILIRKPDHPKCDVSGYISEHRLIMGKAINRFLTKKEVVHHINGIRGDNRIENLKLFKNNCEHMKYHIKLKRIIKEGEVKNAKSKKA